MISDLILLATSTAPGAAVCWQSSPGDRRKNHPPPLNRRRKRKCWGWLKPADKVLVPHVPSWFRKITPWKTNPSNSGQGRALGFFPGNPCMFQAVWEYSILLLDGYPVRTHALMHHTARDAGSATQFLTSLEPSPWLPPLTGSAH